MFDPTDDFAAVADGTETVTLLRRGSTSGDAGTVDRPRPAPGHHAPARPRSSTAATSTRRCPAAGSTRPPIWSGTCPWPNCPIAPRLGDVILDGGGQRWTILAVKRATLGARWRCETRERRHRLRTGRHDLRAEGRRPRSARASRPGERGGRASGRESNRSKPRSPPPPTRPPPPRNYRIFVEEDLELDHTCCIRGPDGTIYTITGTIGAERIGELQVIEAEVVAVDSGQWQWSRTKPRMRLSQPRSARRLTIHYPMHLFVCGYPGDGRREHRTVAYREAVAAVRRST